MDGWRLYKFSDVVKYTKKPRNLEIETPTPFIPMNLIPLDKSVVTDFKLVDRVSSGTFVENGDLLLAKITPSFENGKQGILHIENDYAYATTEVIPMKGKKNKSTTSFISFFLKQDEIRAELAGKMEGSTGRQRLSKSALDNMSVNLPPLPEQRKIAHILSTVQRAIEQQDKLIQTTTELKKALMQQLFTEGTRGEPQKQTEIGPVPESWEVKKLKPYTSLITKGSSPRWQGYNYCNEGVLFVRSQNIGWGMIENEFEHLPNEFNSVQKKSILKENDVLINLVGASIGRVAIAPDYFEGANCNQAVALVRLDRSVINERFLMYFLLTNSGQVVIKANEKAIARANISLDDVGNFPIPIAPINEQLLIVNDIDQFENKIKNHQKKKSALTSLFKTLLHELMTGQRRVHELEFMEKSSKSNTTEMNG